MSRTALLTESEHQLLGFGATEHLLSGSLRLELWVSGFAEWSEFSLLFDIGKPGAYRRLLDQVA